MMPHNVPRRGYIIVFKRLKAYLVGNHKSRLDHISKLAYGGVDIL